MDIIPILQCRDMHESVLFYTAILDFQLVGTWADPGFPAFSILTRNGSELHLSTHRGDSKPGMAVAILVKDIDALFAHYKDRGLRQPLKEDSPVHQAPVDQTWGTREFYVDDPAGNTLRFIQR